MRQKRISFLIRQLKAGKKEFFDEFYETTRPAVFYIIRKYTADFALAEDIMQEAYISYLNNLDKVDETRNPVSYLMTLVRNKTIDALRKLTPETTEVEAEKINLQTTDTYSSDMPLLAYAKKMLTDEEYYILIMTTVYGYRRVEVAKKLNRPVTTVNRKYNVILKKIEKYYDEVYYEKD